MKHICFIDTEVSEADNKAYDFGAVNENDDIFNPKVVNYKFNSMVNEIKTDKLDRPFSLKKAYFRRPLFELRRISFKNSSFLVQSDNKSLSLNIFKISL